MDMSGRVGSRRCDLEICRAMELATGGPDAARSGERERI